jgi:tRNA-(ms[2]io[6]A)-hydroxylase
MAKRDEALPLRYQTPGTWATAALAEPIKLLNDHAHLEKKAASNALELLNRWPQPVAPENWETTLTAIARDEVEHLQAVVRLLHRRGSRLTQNHRNTYASDLRSLVRMGQGTDELIDRLMISALIEARSCERFKLLGEHCADPELAKLYRGLWASEHGHYRVFIELARELGKPEAIERRWGFMLDEEAKIIARQTPGARMHSSPPPAPPPPEVG